MHLGFHYHLPAFEENGKIYTIAFQGLFIDSLAEYCDQVTLFLFTPTQAERKEMQMKSVSRDLSTTRASLRTNAVGRI